MEEMAERKQTIIFIGVQRDAVMIDSKTSKEMVASYVYSMETRVIQKEIGTNGGRSYTRPLLSAIQQSQFDDVSG